MPDTGPRLVWKQPVSDEYYTVTQLAEDLGLTARAIRFYEDKGLISPGRAGNTRVYTQRERGRLVLIQRGKRLGFSLQEIKEYLDLYDQDRSGREQITTLLGSVRERIGQLEEQSAALELTLTELRDIERQADDALTALEHSKAS